MSRAAGRLFKIASDMDWCITDAQDERGACFEEERLLGVVRANRGRSAWDITAAVVEAVRDIMGDVPQWDDAALMVLVRDRA